MREWLTVIVILLILGILLDGWRRMRNARRGNIKMPRSVFKPGASESAPGADQYTSELPNGGARIVGFRTSESPERQEPAFEEGQGFDSEDEEPLEEAPSTPFHQPEQSRTETQADRDPESTRIPQQVTLNLDESVPMLMESVEEEEEAGSTSSPDAASGPGERIEPTLGAASARSGKASATPDKKTASAPPPEEDLPGPEVEPEEVLIINVMAHSGRYFPGEDLLQVIFDCGLRYGSMSIFHRYRDARGGGPVLFSLANMVKPGTFDLDAMGEFQTPGVSLFMTLPMEGDSVAAFDLMLDTAKTLADTLDGELKDENRSVMTRQTMEHDRQRVLEFVRRQLSRVPG